MDTDETSSQEFLDTMTLIFEISSSPIFIETIFTTQLNYTCLTVLYFGCKSLHYGLPNLND